MTIPAGALYVPQPQPAAPMDDPPSKWSQMLAENAEEVRRVELQWGAGAGAYRTFRDYAARPSEVHRPAGGDRYVFELDDGHYGPVELAARLWGEARGKFDDEDSKRGGVLKCLRFSLVLYGDGGKLDDHGTNMHPLTESAAAGPVQLFDVEEPEAVRSKAVDYQAAGIMREQRAHTRELVGTVHSLLSRIEGMAGNIGQLVDGVVAQSAVALQLQQSALDRERELVEDERDAVVTTAAVDRAFDLADKYAGAFFTMRGVNPQTFGPVDPTTSTPVADLCAKILELVDDATWAKLESIHAETFGDLRTAMQLDGEPELRAALVVAIPPVRAYGAAALPHLPDGVLELLEQLRLLVFPPGAA
jgi:hypothetical protein